MMKKNTARTKGVRTPQRHAEARKNINRTHKGMLLCEECGHIFIKKEWVNPRTSKVSKVSGPLQMTMCDACKMENKHMYEGEIIIEGVPDRFRDELYNLIRSYGKRAMGIDSQHRVLEFKKNKGKNYRVTTSENQLAVRLAKKIKEVFRGIVNLYISHSREPFKVNRVRLVFA